MKTSFVNENGILYAWLVLCVLITHSGTEAASKLLTS